MVPAVRKIKQSYIPEPGSGVWNIASSASFSYFFCEKIGINRTFFALSLAGFGLYCQASIPPPVANALRSGAGSSKSTTVILSRRGTMRTILFAVVILCALGATSHQASALTVKKASLEELSMEAGLVIQGRVFLFFNDTATTEIYTYTEIEVTEVLKGESGSTVTVKQLGGMVGPDALDVPGTPEMDEGEEVVLFLVEWKGHYWIHSVVLGMFTVVEEEGDRLAVNDLNNIGLIDPVTGKEITDTASKTNAIPLLRFKEQIRSYVEN
jgi:hypothetical protein